MPNGVNRMLFRILAILMLTTFPAMAKPPTVITDIPPIHSLVAQVMQGVGTPALLLGKGSDPHHFQLRPSQARSLSKADLVVWVGPALTPWLARAINGLGAGGDSLVLLDVSNTHLRFFSSEPKEEMQETNRDSAIRPGVDPHAWLDPENAMIWLDAIAGELARLDPENAGKYRENAVKAVERIRLLEQELTRRLAPMQGKAIIVFHDAYNYFAARFGLTIAGAIQPGDATKPGAAYLARLRRELKSANVVCAFGEPQRNMAQLTTLLRGTGIKSGTLPDPTGDLLPPGPDLYETLLRQLANSIITCADQP